MQTQALPGFRDFYPDDLALRDRIFQTWRLVATRYGFEEYDGPPLEPLELYTKKSGDEIVGQLYNFVDKGDRNVALRPEMTPTLARMVAARANGLKKPIRWFSIPQLFRYERQQRGRLREHFQLNCDLIGEAGPLADAELVALAIDVMRAFGLTSSDVRVRLSDRRVLTAILTARGIKPAGLASAFQFIDKRERMPRQEVEQFSFRPEEFGPVDVFQLQEIASLRSWDALDEELRKLDIGRSAEPLLKARDALTSMGLAEFIDLDLGIVRGLAYYTGIVFELFDAKRSLRAICGGGRYDNLLKELGGVDLPALGFGMGDVVLAELLKERKVETADAASIDVFLAFISGEDLSHVLRLAHQLRDAGIRVEYSLSPQALGKQMKLADARQARLAIVVGPDERAMGKLVLRDLRSGTQETVNESTVIETIKAKIHG